MIGKIKYIQLKTTLVLGIVFSALLLTGLISLPNSKVLSAPRSELNFQGKIVNVNDGTNITNGSPACIKAGNDTCDFRVSIFNSASGGTALWTETHTDVEIGNYMGVFNIQIGSYCISQMGGSWTTDGDGAGGRCTVTSGGIDWSNGSYYMQIELDTDDTVGLNTFSSPEVFTRKAINAVPLAFHAENATTANTAISSQGVINLNDVIIFNDINTTSNIAFSDSTYNSLPGGYLSILHALNAASGGGGGLWTINDNVTYLTSTGSDLSLSSTLVSAFSVTKSENLVRIGDGSTSNAKLDFFSSTGDTGRFEYVNDNLQWSGGGFRIVDNTSMFFGSDNDFRIRYNSTSEELTIGDSANTLFSFIDNGTTGDLTISGTLKLNSGSYGSETVAIQAPAGMLSSYTLTLPGSAGSAGNILQNTGSGVLSWVSPTDMIKAGNGITVTNGISNDIFINFDPTANLNISGQWEFQDNVALRFGNDADFRISFNGTDSLNVSDGTNTLFSIIDTGSSARFRLGSVNDLLGVGSATNAPDGSLYWGNRLLCNAAEANCGWATSQGSSRWTYDNVGNTTYLTELNSDLAIGGEDNTSKFFFDSTDGRLFLNENGIDAGLSIGSDGNLYRSSTNTLTTSNNLNVQGTITGNTGANISGGDLLVQGTAPYNIIIDNSTTGINANSGMLVLRGNAAANQQRDFNLRTTITGAGTYRLSFLNNAAGTEVGYIDQAGNLRANGTLILGSSANNILGTSASSNSAGNNLYWGDTLLCNANETNCGWASSQGSSKWTEVGGITHITELTQDVAIGNSTVAAPFYFDTSAGRLILNVNGVAGGLQLGGDVHLYRSAANVLRTPDAFTTDGLLTASNGATISNGNFIVNSANPTFTGGDLLVQSNTPRNIIIDNSAVGANANSGLLTLRGNAWSSPTNHQRDFNMRMTITDETSYKLSFLDNAATNEIASLDNLGNFQLNGRINIGANSTDVLGVGVGSSVADGNLYWGDKLLCTAAASNCGWASSGGSSKWDDSTILRANDTGIDFAVGGTTLATSAFGVDVSENLVRIGNGTTNNSVLQMFSANGATGTITYNNADRWVFDGGSILVTDDNNLLFGSDADVFMRYSNSNNRLELGSGANVFGFMDSLSGIGNFNFAGTVELGNSVSGSQTALFINTSDGHIGRLVDLSVNDTSVFWISSVGLRSEVPATFAHVGDVQIANNLVFTNSVASYIESDGPLYITAGTLASDVDLVLSANNEGIVFIDDLLEVSDKILLGSITDGYLATSAQGNTPANNLYWGDRLLCDITSTNCGRRFSQTSNILHPTELTSNFAIGASSLTAPFSVDINNFLVRIGSGTGQNGKLDFYASNGNSIRFEMTTADVLLLNNGGFHFNQAGAAVSFVISGDNDPNLLYADGINDRIGIGKNNPGVKLDINGGLAVNSGTLVSLTADEQVVTVGDRSFINLESDSADSTERTFTLSNPLVDGQILVLKGNGVCTLAETTSAELINSGNVQINSDWVWSTGQMNNYSTLTLISSGGIWFELSRAESSTGGACV